MVTTPNKQNIQSDRTNAQLLQASLSSMSALMALQLFSRLFTFSLNQAMFRMVSPKAFGTAAIQFELLLSTILFLSRDGVRNALLRAWPLAATDAKQVSGTLKETRTIQQDSTAVTNLGFIPLIIGLPLAVTMSYVYAEAVAHDTRSQPHFNLAISMYATAAVVELLSEPFHNRAMGDLLTTVRVKAEGMGMTVKTTTTFLILWYDLKRGPRSGELSLLAFACGQLANGVVVFVTYLVYFREVQWWPKRIAFDPQILRLSLTMTLQSIFKHVLTEGDKFILSRLSPLQDQGGYAIAANYGSLVARIVFQPMEEILRLYFSRTLSQPQHAFNASTLHEDVVVRPSHISLQQASNAIVSLLAVQFSLGIILVTFGSAYIFIIFHVLLPIQYLSTSAPDVLAVWIWYIPVLAVNGGLEAFVASIALPKDLSRQSRWMAGFSTIFILTTIGLYALGLGDASLVYANIINLSARIAYSLHFISSYFKYYNAGELLRWQDIIPSRSLIASLLISFSMIHYHERRWDILGNAGEQNAFLNVTVLMHIGLGGLLGLTCVAIWWFHSGRYLISYYRMKAE